MVQAQNVGEPKFLTSHSILDECFFHVSGIANTRNTRIWRTENTREYQENERDIDKLAVWCAIRCEGVLEPYYLGNEIMRKQDFCELLDSFAQSEAENFSVNDFFQHDGA